MKIDILKCHGTSNDFVLIDEINNTILMNDDERAKFTVKICNRKGPIGADGVLFVQKSLTCDAKMRIFNSDGSEAEMCGNGLRCVGRYVIELFNKNLVQIETMKAKYDVKKVENIYGDIKTVEIGIDTVNFIANSLPMIYKDDKLMFDKVEELSESLIFSAVSITNPHVISIVDEIDENLLVEIGNRANNTPHIFPRGVNISFVKILNESSIYVKTFERGVGLTKSCGTGMIASSIIVCLNDESKLFKEIKVFNDGGMIKCTVYKNDLDAYNVKFVGNATFVFKSTIDYDNQETFEELKFTREPFIEETNEYSKLEEYIANRVNS